MRSGIRCRRPRAIAQTLATALALLFACVLASPAAAERLPIRVYTTADGLPHDRISRIVRDSRGFLWFCTPGGLARFDGDRFTTYREKDGLPSESVNDILEDGSTYWIATNGGGVARFDPDAAAESLDARGDGSPRSARPFQVFTVGDQPASNRVNVLHRDRAGRLWAATDGGLFLLDPSTRDRREFERQALNIPGFADTAVQVWSFFEDPRGTLWIGTSRGLVLRSATGSVTWYPIRPVEGVDHVRALLRDRMGRTWIAHNAALIAVDELRAVNVARGAPATQVSSNVVHPAAATAYTAGDAISRARILALYQSADGHFWVGSDHGLLEFDGQRLRQVSTADALGGVIDAFAEDSAGNLWIGSATGAVRIVRTGFTTFGEADGLADPPVLLIFETQSAELCAVGPRQIVNVFDHHRFRAVRPRLPPPTRTGTFVAALQDHSGEWWIGNGENLYRFPRVATVDALANVRWKARYTAANGLAGGAIAALFEDSRGDVWIGTRVPPRDVITRWERRTGIFYRYGPAHGLPSSDSARWFVEDPTGNVWIGFWNGSGVARYRNGRFTWLPSPPNWWGGTSLLLDRAGHIWIGGLGLWRIDGAEGEHPRVSPYTAAGFSARGVVLLTTDRQGRLYLRTTEGLVSLDPRTGATRRYTATDGLGGVETRAGYESRDGTLWFSTSTGISRLVDRPREQPRATSVSIERIRVGGVPRPISELGASEVRSLVLQPFDRALQIDFFGISFETGEVPRYQYRLEGTDDQWSPPTSQRSVTYARLPAGRYRFLVRATDAGRTVHSGPAAVEFVVLAPVWRRPWFVAVATAVLLFVAGAGYRYHVRRLLALERVRTRIATDLHDDIGSSLSQIAILSEVARQRGGEALAPSIANPLAQIAVTSREVVDSMGDIVWAINPQRDRVSDLRQRMRRFASDVFSARGIDFSFTASGSDHDVRLGADVRRHIFLLFKESVTNIARHSGATRAEIVLRLDRAALRLSIADNGRGREAFSPGEDGGVHGHGLASMHARAREVGGTVTIRAQPGQGMKIDLVVPIGRPAAIRRIGRVFNQALARLQDRDPARRPPV